MTGSRLVGNCRAYFLALVIAVLFLGGCGGGTPAELIVKARQEAEKGDYNAAIIHMKNLLQKAPNHAEGRFVLGEIYMDSGNLTLAETALRSAVELGYDKAKVAPALGKLMLRMGQYQKALDQLNTVEGGDNQAQAQVLTLRALATLGLNRRAEGSQLLEQALAKQPDYTEALLTQARLAAGERKLDEAARLIEKALATAPKSVEAHLLKGDLARAKPDKPAAIAAYEKVIEINPRIPAAHLSIASLQIEAGSYDEAGKHIEQLRKIAPNNPMTRYLQALIDYRKRNFTAARDRVLQVLKTAPEHMPSVLLAGAAEMELGSHAQAQTYLQQVIAQAPANLYARKLLIMSMAKSGRLPRALEALQAALTQAPQDPELNALAGDLYLQNNETAKSGQYFEKAAKLNPKSAGPRTGLAMSRLRTGDTERALADLESAVELDSDKYQADLILVIYHLQRSNYDQALKALASLEKKQPNNPLTYNLKASVYTAKKDIPAARKYLERALELQPTYVPAAVNLAQLDLQDKNPKLARQRLEKVLEKDKANVQALLALSNLAPRIGATSKESIGWLETAVTASPGALQPQLFLARAYAKEGDFKKAIGAAERAQTSNPTSAESLDALGSIQAAAGEKVQALATFEKLAKMQPDSPLAFYRLASAQALGNDTAAAGRTLKKALSLKPDYAEAQTAMIELEVRAGRHAEALKITQQMQKQAPKSPLGYVLDGDVRMSEKNYPQAIKSYEAAFGVGKNGAILTKLHAARVMGGKRAEADASLAQWLKDSPEDIGVRLYAAEVSLKDANNKRAIEQYEFILAKQPDNVVVLNNLAWAYQQEKDPRALATAERAYKLRPDSADVADTLGWMLTEQGNTSRGVELLQKAVTAAPRSQIIRLHLAQTYLKMGDKAKARAELERIEAAGIKFPQEAEAAALLKQLK